MGIIAKLSPSRDRSRRKLASSENDVMERAGGSAASLCVPGTFMRRSSIRVIVFSLSMLVVVKAVDRNQAAARIIHPTIAASEVSLAAATSRKKQVKKDAKKGKKKDVAARDARVWTLGRDATGPVLQFGLPGSAEPLIAFSCQPEAGLVRVVSFIGSRGVRPGDGARLRLSNGTAKMEIAGTAFAAETKNEVDIGGATRIDARLFALFRGGDTLLVEAPGKKLGLPVKTMGAKADAFEKSCTPRR